MRTKLILAALVSLTALPIEAGADTPFELYLWPGGRVPYRFADAADVDWQGAPAVPMPAGDNVRLQIRNEMDVLQDAVTVADPLNPNLTTQYIRFVLCTNRCAGEDNYLLIRYNAAGETNNMCSWHDADHRDQPGRNPAAGGTTELHFAPGQDPNTIRHELVHCLGAWHEFNRQDADYWLVESPDEDGVAFANLFHSRSHGVMPLLGNYDFDSIMHYRTHPDGVHTFTDWHGRRIDRRQLDLRMPPTANSLSNRDKSRLLQYYAWEHQENWGFFESLNTSPAAPRDPSQPFDPDGVLPDPYLAPGVRAVGTPAIAFQRSGNYDIFARGSDRRLYWKAARRVFRIPEGFVEERGPWQSLGCCIGSDPSAVARDGEIDVVFIGWTSRRPIRLHHAFGAWGPWEFVRDAAPDDGIRPGDDGGSVGPAVTSRAPNSLDVFVVGVDGRLVVTTLLNGEWTPWYRLGAGYRATARPAAIPISSSSVRLAINTEDYNLYEPQVTFAYPATPRFVRGDRTGTTAYHAPPALTMRTDAASPYRVLIVTSDGRIAHRFAGGRWRDIGGIPATFKAAGIGTVSTGVSAVASGATDALIVMNGEDSVGCARSCFPNPRSSGEFIQPGGLWLRTFR